MLDKIKRILIIENQQFQYDAIYGYLHEYDVYPKRNEYITFIDNVRVWVNRQYKNRDKAFDYINKVVIDNNIDIIIMDQILGGAHHCLKGIDLAKQINSNRTDRGKLIPFLFLSKIEYNDKQRLLDYDAYVGQYPDSSIWAHKGYFGDEILNEDYFHKHILESIEKLLFSSINIINEQLISSDQHRVRIFYSYSHNDKFYRDGLETHLKILERQNIISSWHDRNIDAGDDWKSVIDENLEGADIILLLISADFIASDYCWDIEMTRALERHNANEATVIPIIIRAVNWKHAPFATCQALPDEAKPVALWDDIDTAWTRVSEGIEKVILKIIQKKNM